VNYVICVIYVIYVFVIYIIYVIYKPFAMLWAFPPFFLCSGEMTSLEILDMHFANVVVLGKYFGHKVM
jgi:hypothetical protein